MTGAGRKRETSDEEILLAFAKHPEPVITASEVADRVGMTNAGVNKRLRSLADDGLIVRKEVGARAIIYWLSENGQERLAQL